MIQLAPTPIKTFNDLVSLEIDELLRLRDEVRLKVHLAGMEGRSAWIELERHIARLEERFGHEGDHVVETTRQIAAEVRSSVRGFRKRLKTRSSQ
jgi:hypothetical protein